MVATLPLSGGGGLVVGGLVGVGVGKGIIVTADVGVAVGVAVAVAVAVVVSLSVGSVASVLLVGSVAGSSAMVMVAVLIGPMKDW